jgi:adenylosuccinate lyase
MIERYTRPRMAQLWSEENKLKKWLEVELAVCEAWMKLGLIPEEDFKEIVEKARLDPQRIKELERETKHDVAAFVMQLEESIGPAGRWIHFGLTSYDVVDTALCLLLREALSVILEDLQEVMEVLKDKAFQYKETPMIGRTHGVHAEPITFGFKLALWYDEMKRNRRRLLGALKTISVGKISGAVGTYANVPPQVEEYVCQKLGLIPRPSSQVISRDRHGEMMAVLALLGSSIEKIALEIRHLQRTEVLEVEEPFSEAQKGSSAMPHKRNPVVAENLCGLARLLRGYLISALENIPLWHERDISHSSVERVILPDATILLDFMLSRLKELLQGMRVYPSRMYQNLLMTKGLIFSEALMLKLIKKGFLRKEAYGIVQRNALKAWEKGEDFKDLIKKDQQVTALLSEDEIEECFSLTKHLEHINFVFDKVFEDSEV